MMNGTIRIAMAVLLLAATAGCNSNSADPRVAADGFTLYSIDAGREPGDGSSADGDAPKFHGWIVLGKVDIDDRAERSRLINALQEGIDNNNGSPAKCFNPRHALRIVDGDSTTDYLICFECYQIQVFKARNELAPTSVKLTAKEPEKVFNDALRKAKLPLSQ